MLIAEISPGDKIDATDAVRSDGPFFCPVCSEEVILKKGWVRQHHFSHLPDSHCTHGLGETEEHIKCKRLVFRELNEYGHYSFLQMEHRIGDVIPDVYVEYKNLKVALEIQNTSISRDRLTYKAKYYTRNNIHVLWVVPWRIDLESYRYSPRDWEKWLHQFYYGYVYYINPDMGSYVHALHFGTYWLEKDGGDWGESYSYRSRRYRTPQILNNLKLTNDFKRHKKTDNPLSLVPNALILTHISSKSRLK